MKARIGILGTTALAVAATALAASPAAAGPAGHQPKAAALQRLAASAVVPFSSQVNTMGHTRAFIGSYAGQIRTRSGRLIVYVARSNPVAFTGELQHLARAPLSRTDNYTVVTVPHSYRQLMSVRDSLTAGMKSLQAQGVKLAQWGPDPASNKVQITLESYSKRAVGILMRRYGAQWITVRHATERWAFGDASQPAVPLVDGETRFTDTAPFYAGDIQWYGGQSSSLGCTSGFAFTGNNSGNRFGLASGHCVSDAGGVSGTVVHTNTSSTQTVGEISTEYFPSTQYDIASVNTGGFSPNVYGNGTTTYGILAKEFPGPGDEVTSSGQVSGEVRGVTVENTDNDISVYGHAITAVTLASKSGAVICQQGDSGGPWYVHDGNTDGVWAAGMQVAFREDPNGNPDPSVCAYQQIANILTKVNGSLLTG